MRQQTNVIRRVRVYDISMMMLKRHKHNHTSTMLGYQFTVSLTSATTGKNSIRTLKIGGRGRVRQVFALSRCNILKNDSGWGAKVVAKAGGRPQQVVAYTGSIVLKNIVF